ncbi:MAG: hypothetical protein AAF629_14765 [Chloroflexota bacterium]
MGSSVSFSTPTLSAEDQLDKLETAVTAAFAELGEAADFDSLNQPINELY